MFKFYKWRDYNIRLVLWLTALSILGVLLVGSAEPSLRSRQLMGVLLGLGLMIVISLIDYSWILNFYWLLYLINAGLLAFVYAYGWATHGARRWLTIGFLTFQPVEVTKIVLILFFARYFLKHKNRLNRPSVLFRAIGLALIPIAMIFMQPDLKNTITLSVLFFLLYYVAGISYKWIILFFAILIPVVYIGFNMIIANPDQTVIENYQRNRIMAFLYPETEENQGRNWQQDNSITAIGSGQLSGKGLNNSSASSASKGNFIPETQTDFIFAVAGEELGFFGSAGIVILLLLIVTECLRMGRHAKDLAGRVVCCGMAAIVAIQSFINIGVATGILPNTGTTLPFVSYGLTSLVSLFMGMGVVMNVGLQRELPSISRRKKSSNPMEGRRIYAK